MTMNRLALVAALLVLAGCGSAGQGSDAKDSTGASSGATKVGACDADSAEVTSAKTVGTADLDGDGTADTVQVTAAGGACGNTLFAKLGDSYVSTALGDDEPPVTSAFAVDLEGHDGQLFVTKADHPRGGYQLRIYGVAGGQLAEVKKDDGQSLVPFVALDVQEHPWSIDCGDNALVFTEAVAHEPVGVAPAWDIKQTSYALDGTTATAGPTKEVADNVLPQELPAKYPDLVKHAAFESCRAG